MYLVHAYTMCLLPGVPAYVVLLVHWLRSLVRCHLLWHHFLVSLDPRI